MIDMKNIQNLKGSHWHKFTLENVNILIDVNSGAIHVVDDLISEILDIYEGDNENYVINKLENRFSREEITNAIAELKKLHEKGMFITEDTSQELYANGQDPLLKALCLNVAHDCNLRCRYCFVREGASSNNQFMSITKKDTGIEKDNGIEKDSGAEKHTGCKTSARNGRFQGDNDSLLMSSEIGKKSIDFLLNNAKGRHQCEIDFFGGEPLLNFSVMREITEYGEKKARELGKLIKFTVTTNGILLNDEIGEFLEKHKIDTVLSLDGRKQVNDRMRVFINDSGTYDIVVSNIKEFVDKYPDRYYSVRGTYTSFNIDFAEDVKHLVDKGFYRVSLEPVVSREDKPYSIRKEHVDNLKNEYEKLARWYVKYNDNGRHSRRIRNNEKRKKNALSNNEREFSFFHFEIDLDGGPCVVRRLSGCGAGSEYLAVTPEGKLYPCHQFVGKEKYCMGNVDDGIKNWEIGEDFKNAYVYGKEKCSKCWARFYCGGGCHANAVNMNKSIYEPYEIGCQLMKKRIECAIWIKVQGEELNRG